MLKLFLAFCAATLCLSHPRHAEANAATDGKDSVRTEKKYRYRVVFADKKDCGYSTKHPEAFLSPKALARRARYGIKVDTYDLPLTPHYTEAVRNAGTRIVTRSKWNNSIVAEAADTTVAATLRALPFVREVRLVWETPDSVSPYSAPADIAERRKLLTDLCDTLPDYYGLARAQTAQLAIDSLHAAGYRGQGMMIAVIDGGFYNADLIKGLRHARILGTRNFVRPGKSVYEEQPHGTMVLSCMAADTPHWLVGTAPEAAYYLLVSEDGESEQLAEEDNWCAAVEYADSLGADLITSSLGYTKFDHSYMGHSYRELDGRTAANSRCASLAASRGILLVSSAGNEGDGRWKKIGTPADASDILTVGAVDSLGQNTLFSSLGNTADSRTKPDVMALGQRVPVYDTDGAVAKVNGTSFSCPILCGAAACLMQANPGKRPEALIEALHQSGSRTECPDNVFGYGIPNLAKADRLLKNGGKDTK